MSQAFSTLTTQVRQKPKSSGSPNTHRLQELSDCTMSQILHHYNYVPKLKHSDLKLDPKRKYSYWFNDEKQLIVFPDLRLAVKPHLFTQPLNREGWLTTLIANVDESDENDELISQYITNVKNTFFRLLIEKRRSQTTKDSIESAQLDLAQVETKNLTVYIKLLPLKFIIWLINNNTITNFIHSFYEMKEDGFSSKTETLNQLTSKSSDKQNSDSTPESKSSRIKYSPHEMKEILINMKTHELSSEAKSRIVEIGISKEENIIHQKELTNCMAKSKHQTKKKLKEKKVKYKFNLESQFHGHTDRIQKRSVSGLDGYTNYKSLKRYKDVVLALGTLTLSQRI